MNKYMRSSLQWFLFIAHGISMVIIKSLFGIQSSSSLEGEVLQGCMRSSLHEIVRNEEKQSR